jgi:hypothetical protein
MLYIIKNKLNLHTTSDLQNELFHTIPCEKVRCKNQCIFMPSEAESHNSMLNTFECLAKLSLFHFIQILIDIWLP